MRWRKRFTRNVRRVRSGVLAGALFVLAALGVTPAAAVSGPVKVLGGPEDQSTPAVNATYLIWTEASEAHPNREHAYGRVLGAAGRFRLDASGSRGSAGGIDPAQNRAIFQQVTSSASDLYWFNLETRHRTKLPGPVNTPRWERDPRVSHAFVFFARDSRAATSLFLFDRGTQALQKIASFDFTRYSVVPGSVGERYASWTVCVPRSCSVYLHDTDADTTRKLPTLNGRAQYAPVVDETGSMIYFVRSGPACGDSVGIWRRPVDLSTRAHRLLALPAGIDVGRTMSLDDDVANARLDLWFSRYRCTPRQGDVYELRNVGP